MLYVQLDTNWPDNHKIIDAGIEGAGLHAIVLCLAKRLEDDGWVRRSLLHRQGATDALIDRLVDISLLDAEGERVRPHGWHDRNASQAAIEARRANKAESGKRGNHDRWQHPWPYDTCPKCNPKPQVVAGCDPPRSQEGSDVRSQGYRTPTSTVEVASAIAGAIDLDRHPVRRIPDDLRAANLAEARALKASRHQDNPAEGATA